MPAKTVKRIVSRPGITDGKGNPLTIPDNARSRYVVSHQWNGTKTLYYIWDRKIDDVYDVVYSLEAARKICEMKNRTDSKRKSLKTVSKKTHVSKRENNFISVNVCDLSGVDDFALPFLIQPVTKARQLFNAEPDRIDGYAVVLECDRERALAIVEVIRMKYGKSKIRCYDGKKRI